MKRLAWIYLVGVFLLPTWGCRSRNNLEAIADIDGTTITRTDLDQSAGKALYSARDQLYRLERQKLDEYIDAMLLTREAQRRKVSVTMLLEQEVNAKVQPVTENEIQLFYDSNKARLPVGLEKVHDQIRNYLREQKIEKQRNELFKSLRAGVTVKTYLKPPPVYRVEVASTGAPIRGSEKAPVTIVKFEDFQCPFCKTAQPTFRELLKKYDGKVRLVHKDLPLETIHPQARHAAEAARCAAEQGKFWEYHDKLYADSSKLSPEELKTVAKDLGLNVSSFERCFAGGKYRAAVQKDINEGAQLGLNGTPTFFINGREISGSQPLEAFSAIIDEELAQAR